LLRSVASLRLGVERHLRMKHTLFFQRSLLVVSLLGLAQLASAQDMPFHRFTASVGGGYTATTGDSSGRLDQGGNVQASAGFNFSRYFGISGTFTFNQLGLTRTALNNADQPDGNAKAYTFTADPTIRFPLFKGVNGYLLAGGGWLRRTVQFTQPAVAQAIVFDPWFGYFGPALIPVNQVLGTYTSDAGAVDVGGGLNIPLRSSGASVFVEARYMHGFTSQSATELVPITVGLRW
jgi:hypothetical protein